MSVLPQKPKRVGNKAAGRSKLIKENSLKLRKQRLGDDQFMEFDDRTENIGAQAPGSDGTYHDIRVEEYLHETWEKTSSSVKMPLASAKGIMRRRMVSN